jgi:hypothetical protein
MSREKVNRCASFHALKTNCREMYKVLFMKLVPIKPFIAFLTLLPGLAYADLGDSRRKPHHDYPRDWNVTEVYNSEGIVIKVTYAHRDGSYFTGKEMTQIFKRNNMSEAIWAYDLNSDGTATSEGQGYTVSFHQLDLGPDEVSFSSE